MFLFFGEDEDQERRLIHKIIEYVKRNPDRSTAVIRFWLSPHDDSKITESNTVKAAHVLLTLGEEMASTIFGQFSKDDIKLLNQGMKTLSRTLENRHLEILLEFYELCKTLNPFHLSDHHSFMKKLIERSNSKDVYTQQNKPKYSELEQVNSIETRALAHVIRREHPQTIAVILAHIESNKRANTLAQLPSDIQVDVCMRIARLDTVHPLILRDLKETLMHEIKGLNLSNDEETLGVPLLAKLLSNMEQVHEDQIFDRLSEIDPDLVDSIRNEMFTFDDLVYIDNRGTQTLLKEIEKKVLVLALKAGSENVKMKFFSNISQRAVDMILDDMAALGLVRLSDVKAAQAMIVETALQLEAAGKLTMTKLDAMKI